jgi:ABC-type Mn2+/Zn2+ transport system permease subunit
MRMARGLRRAVLLAALSGAALAVAGCAISVGLTNSPPPPGGLPDRLR